MKMKRIAALFAAAVMTLSMTINAFAMRTGYSDDPNYVNASGGYHSYVFAMHPNHVGTLADFTDSIDSGMRQGAPLSTPVYEADTIEHLYAGCDSCEYFHNGGDVRYLPYQYASIVNKYFIERGRLPQKKASAAGTAGRWIQDANGWWYAYSGGGYPKNTWESIGGKYYYFNGNGYLLTNTWTPDGYWVNGDGVWVQ